MCNLNKKLILFDYMVGKFVEWDKEITNRSHAETDEILKSFGFTRYMKLLYFTCLESVDLERQEEEEEYNLFNTFDTFFAYQNGPVEDHVYNNRSFLFNYEFKGDFLETLKNTTDPLEKERVDIYNTNIKGIYKKDVTLIDRAIASLKRKKNFPMADTQALISLSHNLKLWKSAIVLPFPKLDICSENLWEEKKLFIAELQKTQG